MNKTCVPPFMLSIFVGGLDLKTATMRQVYKKFCLDEGAQDFIGHALALHLDDS